MRRIAFVTVALAVGACQCGESRGGEGDGGKTTGHDGGGLSSGGTTGGSGGSTGGGSGGSTGGGSAGQLTIQPVNATVTVTAGQPLPTLQYTATVGSVTVTENWSIDRAEIGAISVSGLFTPTGTIGGVANVSAAYGSLTASTPVNVKIVQTQIGDPAFGTVGPPFGAGGYGGVGGDGPGATVTTTQQSTLQGTATVDGTVSILYPYDKTVWARGLLAPLLQWSPGAHAFDSVYVHIQETYYEYQGFFGPPGSGPFINVPIPQMAWQQLTDSALGNETVSVTLVFGENGTAYGPYPLSWTVAPALLRGIVYYNSYGTSLVQNSGQGSYPNGNGPAFGGATLSIKPGATAPSLVAGMPSADNTGCRVCHTVSDNGGFLVTQHGDSYATSSLYALNSGNAETALTKTGLNFSALSPDGTLLFSDSGGMGWADSVSQLYSLPSTTVLPAAGIPSGLQATLPSFSPDGQHVSYVLWGGPGADQKSLAAMDFDAGSNSFSNAQTLATPATGKAAWPSFMPLDDAVVYEDELAEPAGEYGYTRDGNTGELWWVDLATHTPARLDQLNGLGYLPANPDAGHADDATLNYEPTVNPLVSGGYAWVVFTSRRSYGNVATIDPTWSDPRSYPLLGDGGLVTCKKLWVAAIDLGADAGTDPSHPAFYLPGQELQAGNSRGFWSLQPCQADGTACTTGDECCGGYCETGEGGGLVCSTTKPTCGQVGDKCATSADCCGAAQGVTCVNGVCETIFH